MPLSFGHPAWLLGLAAAGAGALTWGVYRRSSPPLSEGRRALLGGLRFLALVIVLFLLFEPVWRQISERETPPAVAVLLDDSQSLRITAADSAAAADTTEALREVARRALDGLAGGSDALDDARVHFFGFSAGAVRRLPGPSSSSAADDGPAAPFDSLRFDGTRTDLSAAIEGAREQLRGENLRAIVLASDGQYNTGRNPLYAAARSPVPIHTVTLGDTARRRDVILRRARTNDLAYTDTEVPVRIGVQAEGYAGQEAVQVSLYDGSERLASERITLPGGSSAAQTVELTFTPTEAGFKRLTASVARLDGEATYRNNTRPVSLRVLDRQRQVLLLGAAPGPSFSSTRRLLDNDRAADVTARVPRGSGQFYGGALPDSLADAFDVAVLAGFPGNAVAAQTARRVAAAIDDGLPALFLLSRQTDLQALQNHFSDALPAAPEQVRASSVPATLAPTAVGRRHPVFERLSSTAGGASSPADPWTRLPPLSKNQTRWKLTPAARTLAAARVRGVDTGDPLLLTRRRSGQRSAMLLGSGTWRWANLPASLSDVASLWPSLLSGLVQWTSAAENDRPVRVEPARPTFAGGRPVRLNGQVYDSALDPVEGASVEVVLTGGPSDEEAKRYSLQMRSLGGGRYALEAPALPPGRYDYRATATKGEQTLGTDRGAFTVGETTLEYRHTRADAALMRRIAQRSGGSFQTTSGNDEATRLPAQVARAGLEPLVERTPHETRLWERYGFLVAALLLLGAEWVLRRRSGMS
ncbi:MAG: hypothetical protein BRD46_00080 [Bacteroidetes bacterium QS_8_68_15]|nr:MAG: hypothetical protein BRD46_00080 [Bacteroidetes bacterium QS_8_68_15]